MNDIVVQTGANVPDFLKGQAKQSRVGNIDRSDLIVPRVKLLQAISPEVTAFDTAKAGEFWHSVADASLGTSLRAIPIIIRKSQVLWSPRNDDRGILARSTDAVHWDDWQNEDGTPKQFTVKLKGSPQPVTYTLAETVAESGLAEFGSSVPGDKNSPPAAALTYDMLWYFIDHPSLSPAVIINARGSVKKAKMLISKIDNSPVDHYGQVYKIGIKQEQGDEGPYYNYEYSADGFVQDESLFNYCKDMHGVWAEKQWKASDENADPEAAEGSSGHKTSGPLPTEKERKF